jgi:4a-hydroxytetrahydrobiopterin dehydratase
MALLDDDTIEARLGDVPDWRRDGGAIVRDLQFEDFAAALAYVNRVGEVAEARNHHPDITIHGWNQVRLVLFNHAEGGLTDADFALASALDGVR